MKLSCKHMPVFGMLVVLACASAGNVLADTKDNELFKAALQGDYSKVKGLLAAEADVNGKSDSGATALILENGHREIVQALLAGNADATAKAGNGAPALILASENGHEQVVKALLAAKADVNAKGSSGATALTLASQAGPPGGGATPQQGGRQGVTR